jgi:hypothetical protein
MVRYGTVVNGVVVIDGPPPPEGTRVRLEPAGADDDLWDELAKVPPPPATETREEFLEGLRQSIADAKAGRGGMTLAEAMAELDGELARLADEGRK